MRDGVEIFRQISIDNVSLAPASRCASLTASTALRRGRGAVLEGRLENRLQHDLGGGLNNPVPYCWNAERTFAATRLRNRAAGLLGGLAARNRRPGFGRRCSGYAWRGGGRGSGWQSGWPSYGAGSKLPIAVVLIDDTRRAGIKKGVPTVKSIRLARRVESVDVLPYGGVAPTHLVGPRRAVPVARLAGSRDRCATPSTQCVA